MNLLVVLDVRCLFSERRAHFRLAVQCFLADAVAVGVLEEKVAMHDLRATRNSAARPDRGIPWLWFLIGSQCISLCECCISTHLPPSATSCGLQTFSFKTLLASIRFYSVLVPEEVATALFIFILAVRWIQNIFNTHQVAKSPSRQVASANCVGWHFLPRTSQLVTARSWKISPTGDPCGPSRPIKAHAPTGNHHWKVIITCQLIKFIEVYRSFADEFWRIEVSRILMSWVPRHLQKALKVLGSTQCIMCWTG